MEKLSGRGRKPSQYDVDGCSATEGGGGWGCDVCGAAAAAVGPPAEGVPGAPLVLDMASVTNLRFTFSLESLFLRVQNLTVSSALEQRRGFHDLKGS